MQAQHLTLYLEGYFTNCWDASCFVALTEKQLEFSTARAMLREGQGVPARLSAQAAIARIPALQHGDLWLTESLAIVEYLEDVFPDSPRMMPVEPRRRARARQIMMWLRSDMFTLRQERPWQNAVYPPAALAPLSPLAEREAAELVDFVSWLAERGTFDDEWCLAHADLALALMRIADLPLPDPARRLLERERARPSIRAYLDHVRPPYPPPAPRS